MRWPWHSLKKPFEGETLIPGLPMRIKLALILASMAVGLLTTTFSMFHVDVFMNAYGLSKEIFSFGMVCFAIINAANDVIGSWFLDSLATQYQRSDLVGLAGCLYAFCFLTPFFRPWSDAGAMGDGLHFIVSMSLYDTLYSLTMILYGSIVSDDSFMLEGARIQLLVQSKVLNLVASFVVARVGLLVFDVNHLGPFRMFVLLLATFVCLVCLGAQRMISGSSKHCVPLLPSRKRGSSQGEQSKDLSSSSLNGLKVRQVMRDFWAHRNFWCWIGMELLLESQNSFNMNFRKTFVDRLVVEGGGVDKELCDWLLAFTRPATTILSLILYVPIRRHGYPNIYGALFLFNFLFSGILILSGDSQHATLIASFVFVYPVVTSAVLSAGFALAMADMVLDMKVDLARQGRIVPSMAALFMGANALFCKPAESILPIIAAHASDRASLFRVLVLPPFVFSIFQWISFRQYSLTKRRVSELRNELNDLSDDYEA